MPLASFRMTLLARDGKLVAGDPDECGCCGAGCEEEDLPTEWRIRSQYELYATGPVNGLALDGLPDPWRPEWYYGSPLQMRLEVKCRGEWRVNFPLDTWTAVIGLCAGLAGRYPTRDFGPMRNPCCSLQMLAPGDPPTITPNVGYTFFPDSDGEWTNLANWRVAGQTGVQPVPPIANTLPGPTDSIVIGGVALTSCAFASPPTVANATTGSSNTAILRISLAVTGTLYLNSPLGADACGNPVTITGNVVASSSGGAVSPSFIVGDYARSGTGKTVVPPYSLANLTVSGDTTLTNIRINATHPSASFGAMYVVDSSLRDGRNIAGPVSFSGSSDFLGSTAPLQLNADATFTDSTINGGRITGAVAFSGSSENRGVLVTATFSGSSTNHSTGTVNGNATFSGTSTNSGAVGGDATFETGTVNYGTVSGNAVLNGTAENRGTIQLHADFNGSSANYNTVNGSAAFLGTSENRSLVDGTATFGGSSKNYGTINSDATFNNSSENRQLVDGNAVFNGSSSNYGTILGDATFNGSSNNYGTVTGTVTCNTTGTC